MGAHLTFANKMPTPTAYIYFGIQGDFDPHEFADRIQLSPGKCVAKHASNPEHNIPRTSLLRYAQVETFLDHGNILYKIMNQCYHASGHRPLVGSRQRVSLSE